MRERLDILYQEKRSIPLPPIAFVFFVKRSNNDTGLVTHLFMMRPSLHFAFLQVHRI